MGRVALGVTYDGAGWLGWQTQPHGRTLQDTLEAALLRFLNAPTPTASAGRTDAGVHALMQVVHLDTDARRSAQSWVRGLNTWLPRSMAVLWAQPVPDDFHARFSAQSRTYIYLLRNHPVRSPLSEGRMGWVFRPLALDAMRRAARLALGEHDFSSFRSSECQSRSPVRELRRLHIEQRGDQFLFVFEADAYLHHMVRNLMGTLLAIGQGRHPPEWMAALLEQRDRRLAAPTFSPDGLYLAQVDYDPVLNLPTGDWRARLASLTGCAWDAGAWD